MPTISLVFSSCGLPTAQRDCVSDSGNFSETIPKRQGSNGPNVREGSTGINISDVGGDEMYSRTEYKFTWKEDEVEDSNDDAD